MSKLSGENYGNDIYIRKRFIDSLKKYLKPVVNEISLIKDFGKAISMINNFINKNIVI